ncbi:MAG: sulfurtransferase TusA family protein [Planctomycetota bacterium]
MSDDRDAAGTEAESAALREDLRSLRGARCAGCGAALCGHTALFSVVLGFKDAPLCLGCLAAGLGRDPGPLRDHLLDHIQRRECYRDGWRWAGEQEGFGDVARPPCLWTGSPEASREGDRDMGEQAGARPAADAEWDAGETACGDLVLRLRLRMKELRPGQVLKVTALDPGAPHDLPAWCRLTGHELVHAHHPDYWIARKEG